VIDADPELAALLGACRARPADDLARLVLADYLEERNQHERAELIRLQVELSHPSSDIEHQRQLQRRTQELIAEHGSSWLGSIDITDSTRQQVSMPFVSFQRGLLHARWDRPEFTLRNSSVEWLNSPYGDWLESIRIHMTPDEFIRLDIPDKLHGRIDLVMDVVQLRRPNALEEFAFSSNATMLRGLEIRGSLRGLPLPSANPLDVSKLVSLVLNANPEAVDFVAREKFSSLTTLDFGPLTSAGLKKLCQSPHLRNLVSLNLVGSQIGDEGMETLCASPMADTLRAVSFPNTKMGNRGLMALIKSPIIEQMHGPKLNLMMNRISDVGLSELADCPHLARFDELVLRENDIGDAGIEALADSPFVQNLRYLDLWRNRITDRGAKALAASPYLKSIVDLSVKENRLSQAGAKALINRFGNCVKV
jgi:uncharacterized protein (TIGR02996 family)